MTCTLALCTAQRRPDRPLIRPVAGQNPSPGSAHRTGLPTGQRLDQRWERPEALPPSVVHTDRPQLIKESQREIAAATGVGKGTIDRVSSSTSAPNGADVDLDESTGKSVEKPPRARPIKDGRLYRDDLSELPDEGEKDGGAR